MAMSALAQPKLVYVYFIPYSMYVYGRGDSSFWTSLTIISLLDSSDFLTPRKSGSQIPIHRSRSVPTLNKDGSIRQIDSFSALFRVVPTTPRVAEGKVATLTTVPTKDAGNWLLIIVLF